MLQYFCIEDVVATVFTNGKDKDKHEGKVTEGSPHSSDESKIDEKYDQDETS
jgi:hypothetical protein